MNFPAAFSPSLATRRARPGVGFSMDDVLSGDVFDQVFGVIRDNAGTAADTSGDIADWLIKAGLSVAAIRQILNGVATSADATPGIIAAAQTQARFLEQYEAQRTRKTLLLVTAGAFAFLLWANLRKK